MTNFTDKDDFAKHLSNVYQKNTNDVNGVLDRIMYPVASNDYIYIPPNYMGKFNEDEAHVNHLILDYMVKNL